MEMSSLTDVKGVQRLTGRIASLQRFLSCLVDRARPFFKCPRKNEKFTWTEECELAFQQLMEFLAAPTILTKPVRGKPLILYLVVTNNTVS